MTMMWSNEDEQQLIQAKAAQDKQLWYYSSEYINRNIANEYIVLLERKIEQQHKVIKRLLKQFIPRSDINGAISEMMEKV
ncbi:hypothetical protein [Scytonema sp. NUACC26]|uniref:hypothetical protein n=1 Tax=Scytonema sp. NUACC26 TaxID=3140176 RepID=UPI0034DC0AE7